MLYISNRQTTKGTVSPTGNTPVIQDPALVSTDEVTQSSYRADWRLPMAKALTDCFDWLELREKSAPSS